MSARRCRKLRSGGRKCRAYAIAHSTRCFFHSDGASAARAKAVEVKRTRGILADIGGAYALSRLS